MSYPGVFVVSREDFLGSQVDHGYDRSDRSQLAQLILHRYIVISLCSVFDPHIFVHNRSIRADSYRH